MVDRLRLRGSDPGGCGRVPGAPAGGEPAIRAARRDAPSRIALAFGALSLLMAASTEATLSLGRSVIPLSRAVADTPAAVEAFNARRRIEGLPDTLNPALIDPAKARNFVAGLASQPQEVQQKIAGADLYLAWVPLALSAAAPTRAEAYAAPFTLVVDEVRSGHVLAHTTVAPDPALAQSRAQEAQAVLKQAEAAAAAVEKERTPADGALGTARMRRSAVADAWRLNAGAWVASAPADPAAKAALAAAEKAAKAYAMPAGIQDD